MKLLLALVLLAGCGGQRPLVIGSKPFTESELLGEMAAQLAEAAGVPVERRFYLGGMVCFDSLAAGKLDAYVEYTGTALVNILHEPVPAEPRAVFARVREEFDRRWGILWLEPLGFNNTYALVLRRSHARRLGAARISDLARHAGALRCGFDLEFADRPDGFPGLARAYGLPPCKETRQMNPGLMYEALARRRVDLISGYATDGRIAQLGLVALEDDKRFFPPYEAAILLSRRARRRHPALAEALGRLSGSLDDEAMRALNAQLDAGGRPAAVVAREFLRGKGLL